MDRTILGTLNNSFEEAAQNQDGIEFWFARDLQVLLAYDAWRNFEKVIEKAKEACRVAGQATTDHFVDVDKMVLLGSGAERAIADEHVQNNSDVRGVLTARGIFPEELPPEEDIKKLERRVKAQDRKGVGSGKSLGKPDGDKR
jgi:hypothetical protein